MKSCHIISIILLVIVLLTVGYYFYDKNQLTDIPNYNFNKNKPSIKKQKTIEKYNSPLHSYVESRTEHDNLSVPCPPVGCDVTELKPNVCFEKYCQQTNNQPEPRKPCIPNSNSYNLNCPRVNIWESPMCNVGL